MELPIYLRLALGQTAIARVPVPAHLAYAWVRLDPNVNLRTPAIRCSSQFEAVFYQTYQKAFGEGLQLPLNRTKLRFVYQPASAGFQGQSVTLNFGDTPDVTALTAPIKKLQEVVETATKAVESYSRFIGRHPEAADSLGGALQLPIFLWPDRLRQMLDDLKGRIGSGMLVMGFLELQMVLDAGMALTRDQALVLAKALESTGVGLEPDFLGGAKVPKPEDKVVLFAHPEGEIASSANPTYKAAALTLQLAASVAAADGDFSPAEMGLLHRQVQSWGHLSEGHNRRLLAHLRLLMLAPVSWASLKRKLELLDSNAKDALAVFMCGVAAADGSVSPGEIRFLESVYKSLDIDASRVYSDVHSVVAHAEDQAARSFAGRPMVAAVEPLAESTSVPVTLKVAVAVEMSVIPVMVLEPKRLPATLSSEAPVVVATPISPPEKEWFIPKRHEAASSATSSVHSPESSRLESALVPSYALPGADVTPLAQLAKPKFQLDQAKIAALRKDTDRVSALLAGIFTDELAREPDVPAIEDIEGEEPMEVVQPRLLLGLDTVHTAFARMLLSRPQWTRDELMDLSADLGLMLYGALERINDASFEDHDVPFTEGEDPIEVNAELLEMIEA